MLILTFLDSDKMPWISEKEAREEEAALASSQCSRVAVRLLRRLKLLETALDAVSDCISISTAAIMSEAQPIQPLYRNKAACDALASLAAAAADDQTARGTGGAVETPDLPLNLFPQLEQCTDLLISEVFVQDDALAAAGTPAQPVAHGLGLREATVSGSDVRIVPAVAQSSSISASADVEGEQLPALVRATEHAASAVSGLLRIQIGSSVSPLRNPGLQAILEAVPIGMYVCLPDTSAEWVSAQTKMEAGPPEQQVTGTAWTENVHPDDIPITVAAREVASRTGRLPSVVIRLRGPNAGSGRQSASLEREGAAVDSELPVHSHASTVDGAGSAAVGSGPASAVSSAAAHSPTSGYEWRYYECAMNALHHPVTGAIMRWIGTMNDVHERKLLEQKLAAEKALFITAMDQLPVSVAVADAPSGRMRFSNQASKAIWHLTAEEHAAAVGGDYSKIVAHRPDGRRFAPEDWPMARSISRGEVVVKEDAVFQWG